jgi:hypothetical protein
MKRKLFNIFPFLLIIFHFGLRNHFNPVLVLNRVDNQKSIKKCLIAGLNFVL